MPKKNIIMDNNLFINQSITSALKEDVGECDITSLLIPENQTLNTTLLARENAVLCGCDWFSNTFYQLNKSIAVNWLAKDGDNIKNKQIICEISGNARSILSGERTALNFLQTLSATATTTRYYQGLISKTGCRILDTRKTIPNLRHAQKYAVLCGGGLNHRIGLFDAFLLKENHLAAAGDMKKAVATARELKPDVLLEVEVENLEQLQQAINLKVNRILLDNFSIEMLTEGVFMNNGQVELEASGDITEENILQVAQTGVNFISIGALTKHVRAIDFSLRFSSES